MSRCRTIFIPLSKNMAGYLHAVFIATYEHSYIILLIIKKELSLTHA